MRTSARLTHALIALVVLVALTIQVVLIVTGGADANSGASGTAVPLAVRLWRLFSYFTIQSNLLVLVTAAVLARAPLTDGRIWRVVRLDALLGIAITGLVFDLVLARQVHLTGAAQVATTLLHYVSPWATVAAWLVFGPRPRLTWGTVAAAFIWPALWLLYTFTQGTFTHWYPYPFLDVDTLGLATAVRNGLLVCAVAAALAALVKLADAYLPSVRMAADSPAPGRPSPDQPSDG